MSITIERPGTTAETTTYYCEVCHCVGEGCDTVACHGLDTD